MAEALFDTTVFIDYFRGDRGARQLVDRLIHGDVRMSYSPVSVFELWLGRMSGEVEMTYRAMLSKMEEAPFQSAAAQRAAGWLRGLEPQIGEALIRDALIAATAAEREETIYTRNVSDFQRFDSNVESY